MLGKCYLSTTEVAIEYMLEKNYAFTMCTKYRKIFTEQVQTAHPNVSDADVDTIIETHFAEWFSRKVSN